MTDSFPTNPPADDAEAVYDAFRRRMAAGEEVEIDAVCDDHPRIANALRALHSLAGADVTADDPHSLEGVIAGLRAAETTLGSGGDDLGTLRVGQEVGPYRIVDILGEGGFAVVYKAEQTAPVRRFVALKAIKAGLDTKQVLARFEAERQALAMMSHTGIAKVFDAGTTELGRPFFIMEHVEGPALTDYCDARALGTDERLEIFLQVCGAVQHAHQKGVIHRDLKPANILVASEGDRSVAKVIDFGIAKALGENLSESSLRTEIGQIIGTPAYMSPEQAEGEPEGVDTRTDIYALGVILYELLAGQRPFDFSGQRSAGIVEIQRIIREDDPPRPSSRVAVSTERTAEVARSRATSVAALARGLRGDLDWITMKALAKSPAARYASVSELAEDVRRHQRSEPVLAGPPSLLYRLRKIARRRRRLLQTLAVLIVAVGFASWLVADLKERVQHQEKVSESARLLENARETVDIADALVLEVESQRGQLRYLQKTEPQWHPVWMQGEMLRTRSRLESLEREAGAAYGKAYRTLTLAHDTAPPGSETRELAFKSLVRLRDDLDDSRARIPVGSLLSHEPAFEGATGEIAIATVSIRSSPPGAEVHLFRYEEVGTLQTPRAFGAGEPPARSSLDVEDVWDLELAVGKDEDGEEFPFLPGDRWREVDGNSVKSFVRLTRALWEVKPGASVTLTVERGGKDHQVEWTPFPRWRYVLAEKQGPRALPAGSRSQPGFKPGRLFDTRLQLGVTFDAYPIELSGSSLVGPTGKSKPVDVDLPRGSYLLVFRREGHVDVRYPFVASKNHDIHVELPSTEAAPEGFVYIPASSFRHGGNDPDILQNVPYGETHVDSFWISRLEVSLGDYLEFFRERADGRGLCLPRSPHVERIHRVYGRNGQAISVLPVVGKKEEERFDLIELGADGWRVAARATPDSPVQGLSYVAILEYTYWLSERTEGWRFSMPTDLQWEKAARGADWRRFVWGEQLIWSLCWSQPGVNESVRGFPTCRGAYPFDESVYGVRDLEGSVPEFAIGRTQERKTYRSVRGGGWGKSEEYRFRTDSRFGLAPISTNTSSGIRLVATPAP